MSMVYAPVLIPTLCRDEHFIRCIESLKNNSWAKYTDIYIALDYPAKESHWDGYQKICSYLEGDFSEFAHFTVVKREENYGTSRNMIELREHILKKYDRYIRTDDDIEFSPNFLEYMDKCLEYYEEDEDVIAVTGYSHPINWNIADGCNTIKNNFICSTWGLGFWTNKFLKLRIEIVQGKCLRKMFDEVIYNKKIKLLTNARLLDYVNGCLNYEQECWIDRISDIALGTYITLENKFVIIPKKSKARNWGFDGSGECCGIVTGTEKGDTADNYLYNQQPIDQEKYFELHPDDSTECETNKKKMDKFDRRKTFYIIKIKIKLLIYKELGQERYYKMWTRLKNKK